MDAGAQVFRDDGGNRTRRARLKGALPNHLPRRHVVDPPGIEPGRRPSESRVASLRSEPWCHRQDSNLHVRSFRKRGPVRSGTVANSSTGRDLNPRCALCRRVPSRLATGAWIGVKESNPHLSGQSRASSPLDRTPNGADDRIRTGVTALPGRESSRCRTSAKSGNEGNRTLIPRVRTECTPVVLHPHSSRAEASNLAS